MDFKSYLDDSAQQINKVLEDFLNNWLKETEAVSGKITPITQVLIDGCKGGKRLRGCLVRLGYQLVKGEDNPEIFKAASSAEILNTSFLIHDDIIDEAVLRRGQPSIYMALGGDHYGTSQAIVLGDLGFFLAFRLINQADFPPAYKLESIKTYVEGVIETASGIILELVLPRLDDASEEEALLVNLLKTARYTISGPLQLGATLAGADNDYIKKINQFGDNLGIAFQIQDDILDIFGNKDIIGKEPGADIREGVQNILYLKARELANDSQKDILNKYYGKSDINLDEMEKIKEIFIETKAMDYANKVALEYLDKAKKLIPEITTDQKMQSILNELADFLVERNK